MECFDIKAQWEVVHLYDDALVACHYVVGQYCVAGFAAVQLHSLMLSIGSKFRKNSGRNSGSGPFSGIFGSGVTEIIFLGIAFFQTF